MQNSTLNITRPRSMRFEKPPEEIRWNSLPMGGWRCFLRRWRRGRIGFLDHITRSKIDTYMGWLDSTNVIFHLENGLISPGLPMKIQRLSITSLDFVKGLAIWGERRRDRLRKSEWGWFWCLLYIINQYHKKHQCPRGAVFLFGFLVGVLFWGMARTATRRSNNPTNIHFLLILLRTCLNPSSGTFSLADKYDSCIYDPIWLMFFSAVWARLN